MATLERRVQNGLDETRTLVLGCQILIGVQYQAPLQPLFDSLDPALQRAVLVALVLLLGTFIGMICPVPFRLLVERGEDTERLDRFVTRVVNVTLIPFAVALAMNLYVAGAVFYATTAAVLIAIGALVAALACWYGWAATRRARRPRRYEMDQRPEEPTKIAAKVRHVLTESRVIIPGAQALLGFQLIAVLTDKFQDLPGALRFAHLASLLIIAATVVLLMAPAAYHRIVEHGEETEEFHRVASRFILGSLAALALGMSCELFVVAGAILDSPQAAAAIALTALAVFYGTWFGLALIRSHAAAPQRKT